MTSIFKRAGRKGYTLEYRDPVTRRLRQRSFATKTEAQLFEDEIRAKTKAAEGLEGDANFAEYAEGWLAATLTAVRHGTGINYTWAVRKYLVPAFGHMSLREMTPRHVRDFIVQLRTHLKKSTAIGVRGRLYDILQAAVEGRMIASNPALFRSKSKLMRRTLAPGDRPKVRAFTEDQARAFMAVAPEAAPLHWMMFRTVLAAGLRPGEGRGLQPQDIEMDHARIRLERAITPQDRVEPCKTSADGSWEYVDIPERLVGELRAWIADRPGEEWLFPDEDHGFLDRYRTAAAFRRVLKAAGLPLHFTQKCLRHTFATLALIHDEPVYWVSRQLRHTDISITVRTYGSWLPTGNRAAADRTFARIVRG